MANWQRSECYTRSRVTFWKIPFSLVFNKVRGEGLDSITRRYSGNERTLLSGNQLSRPKVISPETRVMSPEILRVYVIYLVL